MPRITVIISVYNSEKYIKEAVDSILTQTFEDFEFIITDDSSTDSSLRILEEYAEQDNRIILIKNSVNLGLTKNLNTMINISQGKYIARMDADDISLPNRLEEQFSFMENNHEIGVCGAHSKTFGLGIKEHIIDRPINHEEIKLNLLFENIMVHSSIMFRSSVLLEQSIRYNEDFKIMQDYELWSRMISITEFANLKDVLILYRISDTNICAISEKKLNYREDTLKKIYKYLFKTYLFTDNGIDLNSHIFICYSGNKNNSYKSLLNANDHLRQLSVKLKNSNNFNENIVNNFISRYWFRICAKSTKLGFITIANYFKSYQKSNYNPGYYVFGKFIIKCLIRL